MAGHVVSDNPRRNEELFVTYSTIARVVISEKTELEPCYWKRVRGV